MLLTYMLSCPSLFTHCGTPDVFNQDFPNVLNDVGSQSSEKDIHFIITNFFEILEATKDDSWYQRVFKESENNIA